MKPEASVLPDFLRDSASSVAPKLLGCILERIIDGHVIRVRIVEVEAYDETDVASHSYNGRTPRTDIMFGEAGHLYVYFVYGMYYCCNIVVGEEGYGAAVLIRAVEPIEGIEYIQTIRAAKGVDVTNGPAKLCQALSIDKQLNGHDLQTAPLYLKTGGLRSYEKITYAARVGISKGKDVKWRFYIKDNPFVSHA